jgi:hypothetical protein
MIRHFTHLAERADGLARGADVPLDSLLHLLEPPESEKAGGVGMCAENFRGTTGVGILRTLPGFSGLVRRSRPEVGFASVEVSAPWQVSALAGINEAGLAVAWVPAAGDSHFPAMPRDVLVPPLPVADLLVQDCLQRFEDVEAAIGWCTNRPAAGEATILMADAAGNRSAVRFSRGGRTVERGNGGALLAGGPEADLKALETLALAGDPTGPERPAPTESPQLRMVCSTRQLELLAGGGQERVISVVAE